jgi:hypothetical protein
MVTDDSNNVYCIGDFYGSIDFDLGMGSKMHTSTYPGDSFVLKLSDQGNFCWVRILRGKNMSINSILIQNDSIVAVGTYKDSMHFDTTNLKVINSHSKVSSFIVVLTKSGNITGLNTINPSSSNVIANSLVLSKNGSMIIGGNYDSGFNLGPISTVSFQNPVNGTDIFITGTNNNLLTHIKESTEVAQLVFPNPTTGIVYLALNQSAIVEVLNIQGQLLERKFVEKNQMDLSNQKNGIYFLRFEIDGAMKTFKVVKN